MPRRSSRSRQGLSGLSGFCELRVFSLECGSRSYRFGMPQRVYEHTKAAAAAAALQNAKLIAPMYDVIIPARNEASTVAAVVSAAREAPNARRVIVVDDHSSDDTAARAT